MSLADTEEVLVKQVGFHTNCPNSGSGCEVYSFRLRTRTEHACLGCGKTDTKGAEIEITEDPLRDVVITVET